MVKLMGMKKKTIIILLILTALLIATLLSACGAAGGDEADGVAAPDDGGHDPADGGDISAGEFYMGTAKEILQNIIDEANTKLDETEALPTVFIDEITAENAPAALGLLADDFVSFVAEAAVAKDETDMTAFPADATATQQLSPQQTRQSQ